jgi:antitoxin HicB
MKYRVSIEKDEDDMFIARCSALPGCISEGKTRKEALANIKDAMQGHIASLKKRNEPIPPSIEEETVCTSAGAYFQDSLKFKKHQNIMIPKKRWGTKFPRPRPTTPRSPS